jgi:hypothetical protein
MAASGKRSVFVVTAIGTAVVAACGSSGSDIVGHGPSAPDSGISGAGNGGGGGDDGGGGTFSAVSDAAFSLDAFASCAATTEQAKELPLDLYFMLDSSGSMDDLVAAGKSKWSSIVSAMNAFVGDAASSGIGVGLQYFPLPSAGVPKTCTADTQCPAGTGPCFFKACDITMIDAVVPCATNADCVGVANIPLGCNPIGVCHNNHDTVCPADGKHPMCGPDGNKFDLGTCDTISTSTCIHGDSCAAQDYATPAVPIALLPGAAAAVTASLMTHSPVGNTPTSQALLGAIDQAKSYATANPGHSVVAVLATDGIPDECTPNDIPGIAQIAAAGLSGSPSIKTFTIGVFTQDAIASGTSALNQIASAGGTKQAFIIQTTAPNLEQQFEAALNAIRGAALPCQYEVPVPDAGTPDFGTVNVEYTSGAGVASGVPYVETASKCGTSSGWYYDVDPAAGGTPAAILVCPGTCSTLQSDSKGRVDVVVGCGTVTR